MGISKDRLLKKIKLVDSEIERQKNLGNAEAGNLELGKKIAYEDCYKELTKPPIPKNTSKKPDINKAYDSIVKYYVDKKGYTVERANEIAKQKCEEQRQKVL